MRIPRFYCPEFDSETRLLQLPETVHRHAVQVLRLRKGDQIRIFNGKGLEHEATLVDIQKRQSQLELGAKLDCAKESPVFITLMQAISRGERMDYAIQKAVELGVNRIIPVVTERCNVQLGGGRADKRLHHWQGVIIGACEQSGRAFLPELSDVMPFEEVIAQTDSEARLLLEPEADTSFTQLPSAKSVSLLIGPEGGFSDVEVDLAMQAKFTGVRFGPRILRTETAATAALAVIQTLWGDLA